MNELDNGQQTTAVVAVPPIADDQLVSISQRVEQRVAAYNKIRIAALKATNWRHWSSQGGQPYLEIAGAKSIASLVGISWKIDEPVLEWLGDGHFSYTYNGEFTLGATVQEYMGTRSSTDEWFSMAKGQEIPPSEIDRGEVKKAALTNCLGNGVRGILGMSKLTWDDLKAAGIEVDKIGKVEFRKGNADPLAAPNLPNYGDHKGKPLDDPSVPIDALKRYLAGAEKSIADPSKEKYRAKEERLRDALKAEIAKREQALQKEAAGASTDEAPAQPSSLFPGGTEVPDETWREFKDYCAEDADRNDAMKEVLAKSFKVKKLDEIQPGMRKALILTVQDAWKAGGFTFQEFARA